MLNRLKIENFKAWREVDLSLGKVTGFFGTNSAGKSSLFQLLLLLKQTRNAADRSLVLDFGGPGDLVSLGSFKDVVYRHDERKRIGWLLDWMLPEKLEIHNPIDTHEGMLFKGQQLQVRCEVGMRKARLFPRELTYRFDDVDIMQRLKSGSKKEFKLVADGSEFGFKRSRGRAWPLPHPVKTYRFPNETRSFYQNAEFLDDFELAYERMMDSIYYLGPLREYPQREYHWSGFESG